MSVSVFQSLFQSLPAPHVSKIWCEVSLPAAMSNIFSAREGGKGNQFSLESRKGTVVLRFVLAVLTGAETQPLSSCCQTRNKDIYYHMGQPRVGRQRLIMTMQGTFESPFVGDCSRANWARKRPLHC